MASKSRGTHNKDPNKLRQRNLVRGAVGDSRKRDSFRFGNRAAYLPDSLRKIFLSARFNLRPEQYDDYLLWAVTQTEALFPRRASVGYAFFNGIHDARPLSFAQELQWIAARIAGLILALLFE